MPGRRSVEPAPVPGGGLHAIILAAGAAARFGSAKQLLRLDGEPLLRTVVNRVAQVVGNAWRVVLGARAGELIGQLEISPDHIVINQDWHEGIGSSIRTGVATLPPDCEGVLLLLADQAAITAEDLGELVSAWRQQPFLIAAARYDGTTGVPALFPRPCFPDLLQLKGDIGARKLLKENPDRLLCVPMPHAGIDIDTPEDAKRFQESAAARTR